jgi:hypothetical protein
MSFTRSLRSFSSSPFRSRSFSHFTRVGLPFVSLLLISSYLLGRLLDQRQKTKSSSASESLELTRPQLSLNEEYELTMKGMADLNNFENVRVPRPNEQKISKEQKKEK